MKTKITRWNANKVWSHHSIKVQLLILSLLIGSVASAQASGTATGPVFHKTIEVNGINIFYREAGSKDKPTILLLHGYPTSSYMFRNLIRDLADDYHLVAPDYPGYGKSDQPLMRDFDYTFDNLAQVVDEFLSALNIDRYSIYLMDYGAPVGYRIATKHPERVQGLIIQNGNAYEDGLTDFWTPLRNYWNDYTIENGKPLEAFHSIDGLKWQYTHGVRDSLTISPDNWLIDMQHLSKPENNEIQLALFYDYRTNVKLYPKWQQYLKNYQPPVLIVWGQNDQIFPASGAYPYKDDLKNIDFHLLNTGHFALEEEGTAIAKHIRKFMRKNKFK